MRPELLAVDLGNSTCHIARVCPSDRNAVGRWPAEVESLTRIELANAGPDCLEDWLRGAAIDRGAQVCLSSVAGEGQTQRVRAVLQGSFDTPLCSSPPCGLRCSLLDPLSPGSDRLYAARAALDLTNTATIVIDAGTALTVDVVRPLGQGRAVECDDQGVVGEFLGGAIAPGPALLARSLGTGGARLPQVDVHPGAPALGRDTTGAIQAGVSVGFEGAALHLIRRVAIEAGELAPAWVLTGGAAAFLRELLREESNGQLHDEPNLVLKGLAASAWSSGLAGS